ncbi:MAG: acyltransferase family protein [Gammaproteobacteria bacterium]|nr:acyltransferase family protein [Gammaproteobacteria bacterium]
MNRFTLIDGLRGIAAFMVAAGHLYGAISPAIGNRLPAVTGEFFDLGRFGVEIFFVISGFVIAYSVRDGTFTPNYLGKFILRRFIRLDPAYWVIIIAELILIRISLYFYPDLNTHIPGIKQIAAHFLYLQDLLGLGNILPVFWTLCYEVQFYLIFVGALVLFNVTQTRYNSSKILFGVLATAAYIYSVGAYLQVLPHPPNGLFIDRWFQFFLGVLCYWSSSNKVPRWLFPSTWVLSCISVFLFEVNPYRFESSLVVLGISMLIFIGAQTKNLETWLNSRILLFFGTISYALYLIHLPVGWRFIALARKVFGDHMSLLTSILVYFSGLLISILAAWLLYIIIERPSLRFARRIKLPKAVTAS